MVYDYTLCIELRLSLNNNTLNVIKHRTYVFRQRLTKEFSNEWSLKMYKYTDAKPSLPSTFFKLFTDINCKPFLEFFNFTL